MPITPDRKEDSDDLPAKDLKYTLIIGLCLFGIILGYIAFAYFSGTPWAEILGRCHDPACAMRFGEL